MLISVYCLFAIYPWVDFRYFRDKFPEALVSTCLAESSLTLCYLRKIDLLMSIPTYVQSHIQVTGHHKKSTRNMKKHCLKIKIHGFPEKMIE